MPDELTPPKSTIGDDAHRIAKAVAGVVLPAGGDLIDAIVGPPLAKRVDAWRDTVAETIRELLEHEQVTAESLQDDPQFVDVVMCASRVSAYTSSSEKRDALRNAILNTGLRSGPEHDERLIFIRLIDDLTEWHLRVLTLFNDPERWEQISSAAGITLSGANSLTDAAMRAFPELMSRAEFFDQIAKDLHGYGLLSIYGFEIALEEGEIPSSLTTNRGKGFLAFITRPGNDFD